MYNRLFVFILITFTLTIVKAYPAPSLKSYNSTQEIPKAAYYQQQLHITGLQGSGIIEIYSIIGNKISEFKVQELYSFKIYLNLESRNMYIIRVKKSENIYTFKIIAP